MLVSLEIGRLDHPPLLGKGARAPSPGSFGISRPQKSEKMNNISWVQEWETHHKMAKKKIDRKMNLACTLPSLPSSLCLPFIA